MYGVFIFLIPINTSFSLHVWFSERGNYEISWETLKNDNIDTYAVNLHNAVRTIARECIPNKHVKNITIDPPRISPSLKQHIQTRKRAYKKAKRLNFERDWQKFKTIRNSVVKLIRETTQSFCE